MSPVNMIKKEKYGRTVGMAASSDGGVLQLMEVHTSTSPGGSRERGLLYYLRASARN